MKFVICAVIFAFVAGIEATQLDSQVEEEVLPDYWDKDYGNFYDYPEENNDVGVKSPETIENKQEDQNKPVIEENFDALMSDYQFEDNRSNNNDKEAVKESNNEDSFEELLSDDAFEINNDDLVVEPINNDQDTDVKESNGDNDANLYDEGWGDAIDEEVAPLPIPVKEESVEDLPKDKNKDDPAVKPLSELEDLIEHYDDLGLNDGEKSNEDRFEDIEADVKKESLEQVLEDNNEETAVNKTVSIESIDNLSQSINELEKLMGQYDDFDVNDDEISIEDPFENNEAEVKKESLEDIFDVKSEENPVENHVSEEKVESADNLSQQINELEQLMEKYKDFSSDDDKKYNKDPIDDTNNEHGLNPDDDTPEKVLEDLDADLDKLFETLDKLSDNDSDLGDKDDNAIDLGELDEVKDYEEKNDRPYGEGYILSLRDDYDKAYDSNLDDIFDEHAKKLSAENEGDKGDKTAELENNKQAETTKATIEKEKIDPIKNNDTSNSIDYSSELDKLLAYDESEIDQKIDELVDRILRPYGEDGLVNDHMPVNEDAEVFSETKISSTNEEKLAALGEEKTSALSSVNNRTSDVQQVSTTEENKLQKNTEAEEQAKVMLEDLSSSEYNELMQQFALAHSEDLDVNSDSLVKSVDPIIRTLSVDVPINITSPLHPDPYPVNSTIDWIIEGPGIGIEMNLTHCEINGFQNDYLLVKPGGIDANGSDGILFSFRLTSERRYRFLNVNRMFVRFQATAQHSFNFNGFFMSVKLIWPLPMVEDEVVPEPEHIVQPPRETLVLSLAGLTLSQFHTIKTDFKDLIADMAQEYIIDNDIDQGLNTTREVTQITRTTVCNVRWPDHETCVEVVFGVPLHYEEPVEKPRLTAEDLDDMWRNYIVKEKYAARLRDMGITEYAIPNDRSVLMVWLVIAGGVVLSMAMLGFALWRFSCFEDYTRMKPFSDSDSIQNEKKHLDLYPTPHQTLPPLYTDTDYKWADDKYDDSTRVDLGGFANRSYVRDDLFDFESDEDVIIPHDRQGVVSPRNVYGV